MGGQSNLASIVSRRVVIGPTKSGRCDVLSDVEVGPLDRAPAGERMVQLAELWRVDAPLRSSVAGGDPSMDPWQMIPSPGGVAWRLVRWASSSPKMHQTDSLDFLMILEGQIDLEHESGRVRLAVGDTVVIQDALHAWHLIEDQPCVALAVMLRPKP